MQNSQIETNLESVPPQKEIYGSFHLGEGEYAIEADYIQEVVNLSNEYVRMPLAPDFLMGLYNLRGAIIPIIHLKKLFHFNPEENSTNEKLAILNYENCKVGFVFDSTGEILRTRTNIFSKIQYLSEEGKSVIKGVIEFKKDGRMIQVLDLPALLQQQSIPSFLSQQNLDKEKVFSKQFGANGSQKRCVSFCLGNSKFALDVESIKEITEVGSIENHGVTIHSETYLGMMELRGRTIPIINLKSLLGLKNYTQEKDFSDQEKRIIVVDIEGNYLGFLVESLESIIPYYSKELLAPYILNHNHPQMIEACIPRENDKNILLFNSTELFAIREVREAAVSHSRLFPPAEEKSSKRVLSNDIRSYLSFKVKGIFGVAIETVREIINFKAEEVSPAPAMPSFISGLLRLRNDVLYLVDLKDFFGLREEQSSVSAHEQIQENESRKILILQKENHKFGLIVDEVKSLMTVDQKNKIKVPMEVLSQNAKLDECIEEGVLAQDPSSNDSLNLIILNMDAVLGKVSELLDESLGSLKKKSASH